MQSKTVVPENTIANSGQIPAKAVGKTANKAVLESIDDNLQDNGEALSIHNNSAVPHLLTENMQTIKMETGIRDWHLMATILDRMFLIFFLFSIIIVNVAFLGIYPFV